MDADSSMLGKQAGMLPQGLQKKHPQVGQHLIECRGATNDIEWKIFDACRAVEKLMIIEVIYFSKLMPALKTRDENTREVMLKY